MAELVLGLGTPHGPQMSRHWSKYGDFADRDPRHNHLRMEPAVTYDELLQKHGDSLLCEITEDKLQQRYEATQQGLALLRQALDDAKPDVLVVIGDDQDEQFQVANMPMFCVFWGDDLPLGETRPRDPVTGQRQGDDSLNQGSAPAHSGLGKHLLRSLIDDEFDVAASNKMRLDMGLGHAFSFVHRSLMPQDRMIPIVPIMVNTVYAPNQPPAARCYSLGVGIRKAIESWDSDLRVAFIASGGLSHVVLDPDLDHMLLDGLQRRDRRQLSALPEERLVRGSSEIRNWVVAAGVFEDRPVSLTDYVPFYRTAAGTGTGVAFAVWR